MNVRLFLFFLIMFLIGTDTFLISPLLPTLRSEFDISVTNSGWLVGAYSLGYAVFALFIGPISDGLNRKTVMIVGMLGFSISTILCGFAIGFKTMVLFRGLAGIFAATCAPQVWAAIPMIVPKEKIVKSMGIASAGLAVSQALGVPVGTFLALHSWETPFYMIGILSLFLSVVIFILIPNIDPVIFGKQPSLTNRYLEIFKEKKSRVYFFAYFIFQTGNFAAFTYLGTWLANRFSLTVNEIGGVLVFLGIGNLIGSFFGPNFVKKMGQPFSLKLGLSLLIFLYLSISFVSSTILVKVLYFVIFAIAGTVFPLMMTLLQSLSAKSRGTISSLSSSVMYIGTTLGSLVGGVLYGHLGGFFSVTIFTSLSFMLSLVFFNKKIKENKISEVSLVSK